MKKFLTIIAVALICVMIAAFVSCKTGDADGEGEKATDIPVSTGTNTAVPATEAPTDLPTEGSATEALSPTDAPAEKHYQQPGSVTLGDGTEHGVYTAKKAGGEIIIDGVMDDAYKAVDPIEVATLAEGSTDIFADAYFLWDAEYLYLFVNVDDWDANEYFEGDKWMSDSVELVIDTYNQADKLEQNYGDSYRGTSYVGEGQFRVNCGENTLTGMHWMMDNPDVHKEGASAVVKNGYTAEFKIGWGSFGEGTGVQPGDQIAFSICVNDGDMNVRGGVVAVEENMIHAWEWAGALAKLDLSE